MTEGYLNINGARLFYQESGSGDPLVLVHAAVADHRMWDDQWDTFAQQYRVIRYDMRGFGRSECGEGTFVNADDLRGLLDALGIEKAHLLGCSKGGETVLDFAVEHPDRVLSLTAASATPTGFEMQGAPPPQIAHIGAAIGAGDWQQVAELHAQMFVDSTHRTPEQSNPAVRQRMKAMNLDSLPNMLFLMEHETPIEPPAVSRLDSIHAPALLIVGALDHAELNRAADVMSAAMPDARKVVIEGAAHLPNMEQPDIFNRTMLDFLSAARMTSRSL